jgi:hypothetical protein
MFSKCYNAVSKIHHVVRRELMVRRSLWVLLGVFLGVALHASLEQGILQTTYFHAHLTTEPSYAKLKLTETEHTVGREELTNTDPDAVFNAETKPTSTILLEPIQGEKMPIETEPDALINAETNPTSTNLESTDGKEMPFGTEPNPMFKEEINPISTKLLEPIDGRELTATDLDPKTSDGTDPTSAHPAPPLEKSHDEIVWISPPELTNEIVELTKEFREHSGNTQVTFRELSGNIQGRVELTKTEPDSVTNEETDPADTMLAPTGERATKVKKAKRPLLPARGFDAHAFAQGSHTSCTQAHEGIRT